MSALKYDCQHQSHPFVDPTKFSHVVGGDVARYPCAMRAYKSLAHPSYACFPLPKINTQWSSSAATRASILPATISSAPFLGIQRCEILKLQSSISVFVTRVCSYDNDVPYMRHNPSLEISSLTSRRLRSSERVLRLRKKGMSMRIEPRWFSSVGAACP